MMERPSTYNIDSPTNSLNQEDKTILATLVNPDQPKQTTFDFTEDCQDYLLAAIISEPTEYQYFAKVRPEYFEDKARNLILRVTRQHHQKYDELPTPAVLLDMVLSETDDNPSQCYYLTALKTIQDSAARKACNMDYLRDRVDPFLQKQELKLAGAGLFDAMKTGRKLPEAKAAMRAALDFKPQSKDKGYLLPSEILNQQDVPWLVPGIIPAGALCCLAGEPGIGKSFAAMGLAFSVAAGHRWLDTYAVQSGPVVYITCENRQGFKTRLQSHNQYFGQVPDNRLAVITQQYGLNLDKDVEAVSSIIDSLPESPVLIAIDTVNRYLAGNENDAKDMSAMVRGLTTLQQRYDSAVMAVHHTGKDASKYERGHTALRGACETMILLDSEERLLCYKQNHAPEFSPIPLYKHVVGASCVYLPLSEIEQKTKKDDFYALFSKDHFLAMSEIDHSGLCSRRTAYYWAKEGLGKQLVDCVTGGVQKYQRL